MYTLFVPWHGNHSKKNVKGKWPEPAQVLPSPGGIWGWSSKKMSKGKSPEYLKNFIHELRFVS